MFKRAHRRVQQPRSQPAGEPTGIEDPTGALDDPTMEYAGETE
jgi:hypothetical protein